MKKQDLTPLVIRAQEGDQQALNELIGACYQDLYYYAYKTAGSEDLAADVTQESCLEIITTLDKLRQPEAFGLWARRIVYHRCAKFFRDNREVQAEENEDGETIFDRLPDEDPNSLPEQVREDKEFRSLMQKMLDALPAQQRSALMLYYYEKLSVSQIAQIQDTTEGTVKSRLNYGRKAIKTQVEEYEKKTGVRLHSIAPLPLLLLFLFTQEKLQVSAAAPVPVIPAAPAAATAGTAAAGAGITVKVIAGIVAAVVVIGGIVGGTVLMKKNGGGNGASSGGGKDNHSGHTHAYTQWDYNEDSHWGVCECGETGNAEEHSFDGRVCTVCQGRKPSSGLAFKKVSSGYQVTGIGTCIDTDIVIPSTYQGEPVTEIGPQAFAHEESITSMVIPDSVTIIYDRVFWNCVNMKSVKISKNIGFIDSYAFWNCKSLTELNFPNKHINMGSMLLCGCTGLTEFVLPDETWCVEDGMFYRCTGLRDLYIPAGVTDIDPGALHECTNLENIYFAGTMEQWEQIQKHYGVVVNSGSFDSMSWDNKSGDFVVHCTDGDIS